MTRVTLSSLPFDARASILESMVKALRPFRDRRLWPKAVVVVRTAEKHAHATTRDGLAMHYRANDLPELAHRIVRHKVRADEVLVVLEGDGEFAGVEIFAVNLGNEFLAIKTAFARGAKAAACTAR